VAYRIEAEFLERELRILWRREMLTTGYVPRWVDVRGPDGGVFGKTLAFTIDPTAGNYAECLPRAEVIKRLATAAGHLGTSADYLFLTCQGLRACGIPDEELEAMAEEVTISMGAAAIAFRAAAATEGAKGPLCRRIAVGRECFDHACLFLDFRFDALSARAQDEVEDRRQEQAEQA
jgi:hypothetical protein